MIGLKAMTGINCKLELGYAKNVNWNYRQIEQMGETGDRRIRTQRQILLHFDV